MVESRSSFTNTTEMLMKVESALADSTSLSNMVFTVTPSQNWGLRCQKDCMPGGRLSGMHYGAHRVCGDPEAQVFLSV